MSPLLMDRFRKLWFLLPLGVITSILSVYICANFAMPPNGVRTANAQTPGASAPTHDRYVLTRGEAQPVGRVMMTYQGLKTGRIVINVTPVHAETGYAYRRDIPITAAEKGFWLAHHFYRLVSAGRSKLEIVRIQI